MSNLSLQENPTSLAEPAASKDEGIMAPTASNPVLSQSGVEPVALEDPLRKSSEDEQDISPYFDIYDSSPQQTPAPFNELVAAPNGGVMALAGSNGAFSQVGANADAFDEALQSQETASKKLSPPLEPCFFEGKGKHIISIDRMSSVPLPAEAIRIGDSATCQTHQSGAHSCAFAQLFVDPRKNHHQKTQPKYTMKNNGTHGIVTTPTPTVGTAEKLKKLSNAPPCGIFFHTDDDDPIFTHYVITAVSIEASSRGVIKVASTDGKDRFRIAVQEVQPNASVCVKRDNCEYEIPFAVLKRPKETDSAASDSADDPPRKKTKKKNSGSSYSNTAPNPNKKSKLNASSNSQSTADSSGAIQHLPDPQGIIAALPADHNPSCSVMKPEDCVIPAFVPQHAVVLESPISSRSLFVEFEFESPQKDIQTKFECQKIHYDIEGRISCRNFAGDPACSVRPTGFTARLPSPNFIYHKIFGPPTGTENEAERRNFYTKNCEDTYLFHARLWLLKVGTPTLTSYVHIDGRFKLKFVGGGEKPDQIKQESSELYQYLYSLLASGIAAGCPLHVFAPSPFHHIVRALVQCGRYELNHLHYGTTPLHLAAALGSLEVVQELLRHPTASQAVAFRDTLGLLPLDVSLLFLRPQISELLQRASPNVSIENQRSMRTNQPASVGHEKPHATHSSPSASNRKTVPETLNIDKAISLSEVEKKIRLFVSDSEVGDEGARALADTLGSNTVLTQLDLSGNGISEGARAWADTLRNNTILTRWDLTDNGVGVERARALADALRNNTVLTQLDLRWNGVGDEGARALADALRNNPALMQLDLCWNGVGDEGARALADALRNNTVLTQLDLTSNRVGVEGARALADALRNNTVLRHMNLYRNGVGAEGARALADALRNNPALMQLDLCWNGVGAEGARALADALRNNTILTQLDLTGNEVGDEGACALADALLNNTVLTQFDLSDNLVGAAGARALADALRNNTVLTHLDLTRNGVGVEGARALADALRNNTILTRLDLTGNGVGVEGARALADALRNNTILTQLDLRWNGVGDEGARALADALRNNTVLTHLDLTRNGVGDEGARALADALRNNTILTQLDLTDNRVGDEGARALADALRNNTVLTQFDLSENSGNTPFLRDLGSFPPRNESNPLSRDAENVELASVTGIVSSPSVLDPAVINYKLRRVRRADLPKLGCTGADGSSFLSDTADKQRKRLFPRILTSLPTMEALLRTASDLFQEQITILLALLPDGDVLDISDDASLATHNSANVILAITDPEFSWIQDHM